MTNGDRRDDLLGRVLASRYRVEQRLGSGGMGAVYRARHVKVGRSFAIKVLHERLLTDPKVKARFEREAELAGKLHHINVVGVVDVGETEDGIHFMVMEYADGPTLGVLIDGPMEAARAVPMIRQLCDGLAHAHERGLVHRDFKPDNVIVETDRAGHERPRIVDFGVAILREQASAPGREDRLTTSGLVLGTPHYMAPEQASGESIDHRIDLFALGVTCYELLTGRMPFDGDGVDVARANLLNATPPMGIRVPNVSVDPLLEAFTRRLMEKHPDHRPATARAARDLLDLIERDRLAAARVLDVSPDLALAGGPGSLSRAGTHPGSVASASTAAGGATAAGHAPTIEVPAARVLSAGAGAGAGAGSGSGAAAVAATSLASPTPTAIPAPPLLGASTDGPAPAGNRFARASSSDPYERAGSPSTLAQGDASLARKRRRTITIAIAAVVAAAAVVAIVLATRGTSGDGDGDRDGDGSSSIAPSTAPAPATATATAPATATGPATATRPATATGPATTTSAGTASSTSERPPAGGASTTGPRAASTTGPRAASTTGPRAASTSANTSATGAKTGRPGGANPRPASAGKAKGKTVAVAPAGPDTSAAGVANLYGLVGRELKALDVKKGSAATASMWPRYLRMKINDILPSEEKRVEAQRVLAQLRAEIAAAR